MSKRVQALMLVVLMALSPLVPMASAADSIGLSVDTPHVIMSPGDADNLTLSIHNNGTSIVSYNLSVSDQPSVWNVTLSQTTISNVIPTTTVSTSIAIRLSIDALPSDSGTVTITVTEPESNTTTEISVVLSVLPRYLPAIDASTTGDNGLVEMEPGQSLNLSVEVTNDGNVDDTLLLSVDQSPDFLGFWANWTSGANQSTNNSSNNTDNNTGGNNTGNNTGGNNTGGNNTGGNNTGNNTGGNNTGNNTGGNNTGGNNTGNNSNGTILMSSPTGWEVRFFDDTMDNMSAGESRMATLRISIPAYENPGYYGFDLFAATTFGNFSVSSTLVVNVTAVHDLRFSYIPSGVMLQPGQNTTVRLDITSLSSADANWTWGISVESGNCQAILPYHATFITAGGGVSVDVNISANPNNHAGDECLFSLEGVLDSDNSITESVHFTLIVGQQWNLSMLLPSGVKMDVGFNENILVLLTNNGTEEDDLLLEAGDVDGMIITTPEPVTLARGESKYIDVTLLADSSISGNITVNFTLSSANSAGGYIESSMIVDVTTFGSFTISGPNDNRLVVVPGSNGSVSLNLSNSGTQDLNLEPSLLGLPSGISVVSGNDNVLVEVNNSIIVEITLFADAGIQPYSDDITIGFSNGIASASITLELQIINRIEVSIDSVDSRVVASPLYAKNASLVITNLGTDTGTFLIEVDTSQSSDWFDVSLDSLSQNLAAGQSGSLILSVREIATGAPSSGAALAITVTSTSDSTVKDSLTLSLVPQIADGIITIMSDDDSAEPGETIHGTVIVTNMGTATDWMTITTLELDCNLDQQIELGPSMSSIPLPWSCTLPEQASAGLDIVTFRLTSSARSDMLVTTLEAYTIEPIWDSNGVIIFTISEDDFEMNMQDDRKIMVRVCNHANTDVSGVIEVTGTNSLRMHASFSHVGGEELNSSFELANLGCKDFNLLLVTQDLEGYDASIIVRAVTQVDGSTIIDESEPITITIKGPEQPPEGINFGFMELNNKNSMTALASGWILTILLLAYIRYFRKPAIEEEEEEEELVELGINEVRIDENGKVTCCSCDQLLGVPRGNEPPFKFTCPKCSTKIRVVE